MEQAPGELEPLEAASVVRVRRRIQATFVWAALLEAHGVRREHDVAAPRELQGVRLLGIAGQSGYFALAKMKLPGVLMMREDAGPTLVRSQRLWQEQVGRYPLGGLWCQRATGMPAALITGAASA